MELALTAEQAALRETARRYCADHCGFEARGARGQAEAGGSHWRRFAELGWLGVAFPEDVGGSGGSAIESAILHEEFGRALVVEPLLACATLAPRVLVAAATQEQRRRWLPPILRGELRLALAHTDHPEDGPGTVARCGPRGAYVLEGKKALTLGGADAEWLLVSARPCDEPAGADGPSLFVIDARRAGVARRSYATLDGARACDVVLEGVRVERDELLGEPGSGAAAVRAGLEHAMVGACAEAVGAMDGLLWLTRDYLRQRRQYGAALGSLQALQHRLAEMFAELELSRSMLHQGLRALAQGDGELRQCGVRSAKAYVGRSGLVLGQTAIQLHGAIGLADEYKASHYFRRLVTLAALFGHPDRHLQPSSHARPARDGQATPGEAAC